MEMEKTCPICGDRFWAVSSRMYCSKRCRERSRSSRSHGRREKFLALMDYVNVNKLRPILKKHQPGKAV